MESTEEGTKEQEQQRVRATMKAKTRTTTTAPPSLSFAQPPALTRRTSARLVAASESSSKRTSQSPSKPASSSYAESDNDKSSLSMSSTVALTKASNAAKNGTIGNKPFHNMCVLDKILPFFDQQKLGIHDFVRRAQIQQVTFPPDKEEETRLVDFDNHMKRQHAGGKHYKTSSVRPIDVILGRGPSLHDRPGNWFMRQIVLLNKDIYGQLPRADKHWAAVYLVDLFVQQLGVRFLECSSVCNDDYTPVSYPRILEKFMQSLREKKQARHGLCLPQLLEQITEKQFTGLPSSSLPPLTRKNPVKIKKPVKHVTRPADVVPSHSSRISKPATKTKVDETQIKAATTHQDVSSSSKETPHRTTFQGFSCLNNEANASVVQALEKDLKKRGSSLAHFIKQATLGPHDLIDFQERHAKASKPRGVTSPAKAGLAPMDVCLGRGHNILSHPGNVLFRYVCSINQDVYSQKSRHEKSEVAKILMDLFVQAGARFVESNGTSSKEQVSHDRILEKFKQGLREKCLAKYSSEVTTTRLLMERSHQHVSATVSPSLTSAKATVETRAVVTPDSSLELSRKRNAFSHCEKRSVKGAIVRRLSKRAHRENYKEKLLSVGHFVLSTPDTDQEYQGSNPLQEDHALQEIRSAFRSKTFCSPISPTQASVKSSCLSDDGLAQLYHSQSCRVKRGVKNPLPLFFSDT